MPLSPIGLPSRSPDVATSTAPGLMVREGSQHSIGVAASVVGISGVPYQLAVRSPTPPSSEDTICQGGTCRCEGLEISSTSGPRGARNTAVDFDFSPSLR